MKNNVVSRPQHFAFALLTLSLALSSSRSQDQIFSGPQTGEKTTPFKVIDVKGPKAGQERDVIAAFHGAPTTLVFVHGIERSMAPLMMVIDQYATERKETLKAVFVFLSHDRVADEKRLPAVGQSLRLQSPMTLSLDGAEGPGNYGLNKGCLLTVVIAKENKVTANFALVQPGIADAPKIIAAMAQVCGDAAPPTAEVLQARRQQLYGGMPGRPGMRERSPDGMLRPNAAADLSKLNLDSEAGVKDALKALIGEVQALRKEVDELRGRRPQTSEEKRPIHGAAPTDQKLLSLLRAFIQPTNDDGTVDRVLKEATAYVRGDADLTKQMVDGWTRVIHLKYGTEYARQAGLTLVEKLKQ